MKAIPLTALAVCTVLLGACETVAPPASAERPLIEVYRAHQGAIAAAPIAVAPVNLGPMAHPATGTYVRAVRAQFARLGFRPVKDVAQARLFASVTAARSVPSELTSGGLLPPTTAAGPLPTTSLAVEVRSRATGEIVWQGRATTDRMPAGDNIGSLADDLARALFAGFPGESGRTISVR